MKIKISITGHQRDIYDQAARIRRFRGKDRWDRYLLYLLDRYGNVRKIAAKQVQVEK